MIRRGAEMESVSDVGELIVHTQPMDYTVEPDLIFPKYHRSAAGDARLCTCLPAPVLILEALLRNETDRRIDGWPDGCASDLNLSSHFGGATNAIWEDLSRTPTSPQRAWL